MNEARFCPNCGQPTEPGQRFCAHCGTALSPSEVQSTPTHVDQPGPAAPPPSEPPGPGRKRRPLIWRIAMIAVPLILVAGGVAVALIVTSGSSDDDERARSSSESEAAAQAQTAEERRAAQAKYDTCQEQMGALIDSLSALDSRLDVGMNYGDYTDAVGDLRVEYDKIPFDDANDPECLTSVGLPAEQAFNHYAKATRIWDACFDDFNCSNDSIEPKLRRYWDKASTSIDNAKDGLDSLKPTS